MDFSANAPIRSASFSKIRRAAALVTRRPLMSLRVPRTSLDAAVAGR